MLAVMPSTNLHSIYKKNYFFFEWQRKKREKGRSFTQGLTLQMVTEVDRAKVRNQELYLGITCGYRDPNSWVISHFFFHVISTLLNWKESIQKQTLMPIWDVRNTAGDPNCYATCRLHDLYFWVMFVHSTKQH